MSEPKENNSITIYFLYTNENNEVYSVKQIRQNLDYNKLSKEKQLFLITKNQYNLFRKHKLTNISYFEINIENNNIQKFIDGEILNNFLTTVKIIDDISFTNTDNIFKKFTCVYYVYKVITQSNNTTRRIILTNSKNKTHKNTKN